MKLLKNFITVIGLAAVVLFGFMLYHQSTGEPIDDMAIWHDLHKKANYRWRVAPHNPFNWDGIGRKPNVEVFLQEFMALEFNPKIIRSLENNTFNNGAIIATVKPNIRKCLDSTYKCNKVGCALQKVLPIMMVQ